MPYELGDLDRDAGCMACSRLGIAYLFGSLIRGAEAPDAAGDLVPPVLSYLRREKRAKASGNG